MKNGTGPQQGTCRCSAAGCTGVGAVGFYREWRTPRGILYSCRRHERVVAAMATAAWQEQSRRQSAPARPSAQQVSPTRRVEEILREAFRQNALPETATVSRNGRQVVIRWRKISVTCYTP